MAKKSWKIKTFSPEALALSEKAKISLVFAQVLVNRKISYEALGSFLNPSLDSLHDPLLLPDMAKAVDTIKMTLDAGQKILVAGDYDVDGVTSLTIFHDYVKDYPEQYRFYIPHRVHDGYGLSIEAVEKAKEFGSPLIVAFDCGTNSTKEIEYAKANNIDVIVIDHHHPHDDFNSPLAFVNPKRKDSAYPFKELSSGGLSFKLLQALTGETSYEALDLAAMSTVCDVVSLTGENRAILKAGLEQLQRSPRPGIVALCEASKIEQANLSSFHLGFVLGPRINASGRVAHAQDALDLFLASDLIDARHYAAKLCDYNQQRKNIEADILKAAQEIVDKDCLNDHAIVASGDGWHPGVLGIVASRLCEKYDRPAFVISFENGVGKGSGRSVDGVHLMQTLEFCGDTLVEYGGHRKAAGLSIAKENIGAFKEKLNLYIKNNAVDCVSEIEVDALLSFADINLQVAQEIESLKPFGEENPKALFAAHNVIKKMNPRKLKFGYSVWLNNGGFTYEAMTYDSNLASALEAADKFNILFHLEINSYHHTPRLVLKSVEAV